MSLDGHERNRHYAPRGRGKIVHADANVGEAYVGGCERGGGGPDVDVAPGLLDGHGGAGA